MPGKTTVSSRGMRRNITVCRTCVRSPPSQGTIAPRSCAARLRLLRTEEARLRDREPEEVASHPVERHLRREELHPLARAPELVAARDDARLGREAEADRPDRLLRRPAVRARDPG